MTIAVPLLLALVAAAAALSLADSALRWLDAFRQFNRSACR